MTNNLTESSLNKLNSTLRLPVPMPMPVPTSLDVIVFPSGSRRIPLFPVNGLFQRGACHRMGEGGQFGHSRAGVRYFHRERELELPTWRPSSRYTSHNTPNAAFNLLKILFPDTKRNHATVETTSKKLFMDTRKNFTVFFRLEATYF